MSPYSADSAIATNNGRKQGRESCKAGIEEFLTLTNNDRGDSPHNPRIFQLSPRSDNT